VLLKIISINYGLNYTLSSAVIQYQENIEGEGIKNIELLYSSDCNEFTFGPRETASGHFQINSLSSPLSLKTFDGLLIAECKEGFITLKMPNQKE
jgi:hypothetical protein